MISTTPNPQTQTSLLIRDLPDEDIDDSNVTYESVACAFMMSLLDFQDRAFRRHQVPGVSGLNNDGGTESSSPLFQFFVLCTKTDQRQNHIWQSTYDLNQHMLGSIHSPYSAWRKGAEMRHKELGEARYRCPYGVCENSYTFLNVLVR